MVVSLASKAQAERPQYHRHRGGASSSSWGNVRAVLAEGAGAGSGIAAVGDVAASARDY